MPTASPTHVTPNTVRFGSDDPQRPLQRASLQEAQARRDRRQAGLEDQARQHLVPYSLGSERVTDQLISHFISALNDPAVEIPLARAVRAQEGVAHSLLSQLGALFHTFNVFATRRRAEQAYGYIAEFSGPQPVTDEQILKLHADGDDPPVISNSDGAIRTFRSEIRGGKDTTLGSGVLITRIRLADGRLLSHQRFVVPKERKLAGLQTLGSAELRNFGSGFSLVDAGGAHAYGFRAGGATHASHATLHDGSTRQTFHVLLREPGDTETLQYLNLGLKTQAATEDRPAYVQATVSRHDDRDKAFTVESHTLTLDENGNPLDSGVISDLGSKRFKANA